jgi:hypothetical protein
MKRKKELKCIPLDLYFIKAGGGLFGKRKGRRGDDVWVKIIKVHYVHV